MQTFKITSVLAIVLLSTTAVQANGFDKVMGETLAKYATCRTSADFSNLSSTFERIARKDTAEWLPRYYQVHTLVIASFMGGDAASKDALLDRAEPVMKALLKMEPNNAEIHVLHAMYYTARLVVDPASRGQEFSMLSGQAIGKAAAIDPENPRVKYMDISGKMGEAQFFGRDISAYCRQAAEAVKAFDDYPVKSPIHPNWGKDQLEEQAANCK